MSTVPGIVEERGRLGTRLAKVYDADGEEIAFDIREDEAQVGYCADLEIRAQ